MPREPWGIPAYHVSSLARQPPPVLDGRRPTFSSLDRLASDVSLGHRLMHLQGPAARSEVRAGLFHTLGRHGHLVILPFDQRLNYALPIHADRNSQRVQIAAVLD